MFKTIIINIMSIKYNVMATDVAAKGEILDNLDKFDLMAEDPNFLV